MQQTNLKAIDVFGDTQGNFVIELTEQERQMANLWRKITVLSKKLFGIFTKDKKYGIIIKNGNGEFL